MIIVTNNSRSHAINIGGRSIAPRKSATFDKINDTGKLNYLLSTGDINVRYETTEAKPKNVTRKSSIKDTIIIDSTAKSDDTAEAE